MLRTVLESIGVILLGVCAACWWIDRTALVQARDDAAKASFRLECRASLMQGICESEGYFVNDNGTGYIYDAARAAPPKPTLRTVEAPSGYPETDGPSYEDDWGSAVTKSVVPPQ